MIQFTQGDMFETPADIRVNTVNCVGIMGAGLALAFKQRYPDMFRDYQKACTAGEVRPGHLHIWRSLDGAWIINFPTKRHWRDKSRYEDIEAGLDALHEYLTPLGKVVVALPALGCGHGGLDWSRVSAMIESKLGALEAEFHVYPPSTSKLAGQTAVEIATDDEINAAKALGYRETLSPDQRTSFVRGDDIDAPRPWIAIIPSKQPSEREVRALTAVASAITADHPDAEVAMVHSGRASEDLARMFAESGVSVTVIAPFGVLTRKSLTKIAAGPSAQRVRVRSWAPLNANWGRQHLAEALEQLRLHATALLISDPEPAWFLRQSRTWRHLPMSYLRYDGLPSQLREELDRAGVQALARRSDTGALRLDALYAPKGDAARSSKQDPKPRRVVVLQLDDLPPQAWPQVLARISEGPPSRIRLTVELDDDEAAAALEDELTRLTGNLQPS
jgi:O-acetyl-ADP-ribose deacetylase (regulator of RNase III)